MSKVIHCTALPHLAVHRDNSPCAYQSKTRQFARSLRTLGYHVTLYAPEGSDPTICDELVITTKKDEIETLYGTPDRASMYPLKWDINDPLWMLANARAITEIKKRKQPGDFLCVIGGTCQQPIATHAGDGMIVVEFGIGYEGVFAPNKVFESYAHRAMITGLRKQHNAGCPETDTVIPNLYDVADFPFQPIKQDYFLYIGRLTKLKGVEIAAEACRRAGVHLAVAGQGITQAHPTKIITKDFTIDLPNVKYIGVLNVEQRAQIVGSAAAVIAPTLYHGPFEGVVAEAQLYGTPVITTDWGCFAETVSQNKTGYRCRTINQFVDAIGKVKNLDPVYIRERAVGLWSADVVKHQYDEYFQSLPEIYAEREKNRSSMPIPLPEMPVERILPRLFSGGGVDTALGLLMP